MADLGFYEEGPNIERKRGVKGQERVVGFMGWAASPFLTSYRAMGLWIAVSVPSEVQGELRHRQEPEVAGFDVTMTFATMDPNIVQNQNHNSGIFDPS